MHNAVPLIAQLVERRTVVWSFSGILRSLVQIRLKGVDILDFPGGSGGKESACNAGHLGLIPGLGRSLEKGMATHSSILAWRIPWTEEPGGLYYMRSQRVRHD